MYLQIVNEGGIPVLALAMQSNSVDNQQLGAEIVSTLCEDDTANQKVTSPN